MWIQVTDNYGMHFTSAARTQRKSWLQVLNSCFLYGFLILTYWKEMFTNIKLFFGFIFRPTIPSPAPVLPASWTCPGLRTCLTRCSKKIMNSKSKVQKILQGGDSSMPQMQGLNDSFWGPVEVWTVFRHKETRTGAAPKSVGKYEFIILLFYLFLIRIS